MYDVIHRVRAYGGFFHLPLVSDAGGTVNTTEQCLAEMNQVTSAIAKFHRTISFFTGERFHRILSKISGNQHHVTEKVPLKFHLNPFWLTCPFVNAVRWLEDAIFPKMFDQFLLLKILAVILMEGLNVVYLVASKVLVH